ncbi:MAG TPA: hypothetical protein VJ044_18215 [Candidatus Hodarchaeales archaeon]|nr:hypothetical protein [Candidatus Hodarchaeales archaeon]
MREVIALVSDRGKELVKPFVKPGRFSKEESFPIIMGLGILAFFVYEIVIFLLLELFNLNRNPFVFWVELVIFGLVCSCLYLYSRVNLLSAFQTSDFSDSEFKDKYNSVVQFQKENSVRLETFANGIEQSLSAVMFFARVHLARSGNPQLQRDLMEVMERIDQVQLLLREMKFPLNLSKGSDVQGSSSLQSFDPREFWESGKSTGSQYAEGGVSPAVFSLRKSARKTQIIPITVHYSHADRKLEFQSYTVNTCDSGACIVFSDQGITEDTIIEFQIPSEFQSRAQIKWIQPLRANTFRLAGIEFLDNRTLRIS